MQEDQLLNSSLDRLVIKDNDTENFFHDSTELSASSSYIYTCQQDDSDDGCRTCLCDLADELIIHILRFLSPFDLRLCCTVSKLWFILSEDSYLWYEKCLQQWGWMTNINDEKKYYLADSSWKEFYKFWAIEYLKHSGWYENTMSREESIQRLMPLGKGTFLIRKSSSKPNYLVISYNVRSKRPQHLLINNLGSFNGVFLNEEIGKIYPTLAALVKDKMKFLKRPFNQCKQFETKSSSKHDFIITMINNPKERQGKSINELLLLHLACKWCFEDLVVKLLEMDASIFHRSLNKGRTPLHHAIGFVHGEPSSNNRLRIVNILIEYCNNNNNNNNKNNIAFNNSSGSNCTTDFVNLVDYKGRSALHIAVKQHQHITDDLVKLLLENGGNPCTYDNKGLYPLHIATKENNLSVVKLLLKHQSINVNCKIEHTILSQMDHSHGDTPLMMASESCMLSIVKELLSQKNLMVNEKDNKQRTSLHRAVLKTQDWLSMTRFGKPSQSHFSHQVAEELLKNNAELYLLDYQNKTPLHISIEKGHRQSTLTLINELIKNHQQLLPMFKPENLLECITFGKESDDIKKIISDLSYSILCGFNETSLESLQITIDRHYRHISNAIDVLFTKNEKNTTPNYLNNDISDISSNSSISSGNSGNSFQ